MSDHIHSFLLSGGVGSRLWPISRKDAPKQFHQLASESTLFEDSINRLQAIKDSTVYLLASSDHDRQIEGLREEFGLLPENCILEPMGRNTAAAIAVAVHTVLKRYGDGLILIAPSDHKIGNNKDFATCVASGMQSANDGAIVVFGIPPKRAETGFGYIEVDANLNGSISDVVQFKEKPNLETAQKFLEQGNFYWNAGIFLFKASTVQQHFENYCPDIWQAASAALNNAVQKKALYLPAPQYRKLPSESFDIAIMQKAGPIKMVRADFSWSDLGSWEAIYEMGDRDDASNLIHGDIVASDCNNSLLWSDGPLVAAYGMDNSAIIATKDAVFVSSLPQSQQVKVVYDLLAKADRVELKVSPSLRYDKGAHVIPVRTWLIEQALPLWAEFGVDRDTGGFHEVLDFNAKPVPANKRLRTMARQTYCFAVAAQRCWHADAEQIAEHGIKFIAEQARLSDGGFAKELSFDGKISDPTEDLYDMAFVLFTSAHATRAKITGARALAETAFQRLENHFLFEDGQFGYRNSPQDTGPVTRANPLMHMVEALLVWHEVSSDELAAKRATQLVDLFFSKFYSSEDWAVREILDSSFESTGDPRQNICEPGHHMEWGWLLYNHNLRSAADSMVIIRRLYASANSFGRNPMTNLSYQSVNWSGAVLDDTSRCWPQSEAIRAAIALSDLGIKNFDNEVEWRISLLFDAHLNNAPEGMWIDSIDSTGNTLSKSVPASIFYHHLGAMIAYLDHVVK